MSARLAADVVVLLHLGLILFAVSGGLFALRNLHWLWLHLPALAWGLWVELHQGLCPLTCIENAMRQRAGEAGYAGGFIDHYLLPLIYPPGLGALQQLVIGTVFALWSFAVYGLVWRHHRSRRKASR